MQSCAFQWTYEYDEIKVNEMLYSVEIIGPLFESRYHIFS